VAHHPIAAHWTTPIAAQRSTQPTPVHRGPQAIPRAAAARRDDVSDGEQPGLQLLEAGEQIHTHRNASTPDTTKQQ
jgi:hypothetical protein